MASSCLERLQLLLQGRVLITTLPKPLSRGFVIFLHGLQLLYESVECGKWFPRAWSKLAGECLVGTVDDLLVPFDVGTQRRHQFRMWFVFRGHCSSFPTIFSTSQGGVFVPDLQSAMKKRASAAVKSGRSRTRAASCSSFCLLSSW